MRVRFVFQSDYDFKMSVSSIFMNSKQAEYNLVSNKGAELWGRKRVRNSCCSMQTRNMKQTFDSWADITQNNHTGANADVAPESTWCLSGLNCTILQMIYTDKTEISKTLCELQAGRQDTWLKGPVCRGRESLSLPNCLFNPKCTKNSFSLYYIKNIQFYSHFLSGFSSNS